MKTQPMKLKIWCDSGANAHSKRVETIAIEDIGLTAEQWKAMNDDQREKTVKEVAFAQLDWGWEELP